MIWWILGGLAIAGAVLYAAVRAGARADEIILQQYRDSIARKHWAGAAANDPGKEPWIQETPTSTAEETRALVDQILEEVAKPQDPNSPEPPI